MTEPVPHPWIDSTFAPCYIWTFPNSRTEDDLRACCAAREAWSKRANYHVSWVVDMSYLKDVSATERKIFSEHLDRFEAHDARYNKGSAIIVPNGLLRGVATAVFWVKKPRFPNRLFPNREEGFRWAQAQLTARAI